MKPGFLSSGAGRSNKQEPVAYAGGKDAGAVILTCYVAGSSKEVERVREVQAMVRAAGFRITFDWTGPEGEIRTDWSGEARPRGARIAQREIEACRCDLFVLVTPPAGRGLGCFVEMGAAMARGAVCLVLPLEGRDSVFFAHHSVTVVPDLATLSTKIDRVYRQMYEGLR